VVCWNAIVLQAVRLVLVTDQAINCSVHPAGLSWLLVPVGFRHLQIRIPFKSCMKSVTTAHVQQNLHLQGSLYRYAPHNDVSANDGPHIRRWSHNIIIYNICGPGSSFGMVRDRIPVGTRFSALPDRPWGPPSLLFTVFPGGKVRPGRAADLLVPRSRKSRAIPLPTLWATPGL